MQRICRIQPEERSDIGGRDAEGEVRIEVVVEVGAQAEGRLGGFDSQTPSSAEVKPFGAPSNLPSATPPSPVTVTAIFSFAYSR